MRFPGHGPGYRFHPTDVELTMYYLKNKVTGRKVYPDDIQERDVYNLDPRDLKGPEHFKGNLKRYFFCPREMKYSTGKRTNRSTEQGSWSKTGNDRPVYYKNEHVGMIKSLVFYERNPKKRTNWVMHEYRLQDDYLKQLGLEEDAFVLCVVFEKDGPGPQNGAQYGSPYREEDWDDANGEPNICEENALGVGEMSQACDSTDRGKSAVRNEFDLADRYFVGSSSRTYASDIDQSANHGFQPTPVLGTLPVNSQLPLTNQLLSASLGNQLGQDIGVDQNCNCEPAIPDIEKNAYESSGDFFSYDDIHDSGVNACDNDSLANQNILPDDFLEADDCLEVDDCRDGSDSFEGPHDPPQMGISDITPSWNMHRHEPAQMNRSITGTQTDSSQLIAGDFPNSSSLAMHGPPLDQHSPVSEGSMGFNGQGYGVYGLSWQHHEFSDWLCGQDFGDDVQYFNQHQLGLWPFGFDGQGFGENLLHLNPDLQFAQGTDGFVTQSLRENVTPLHGPQFDEDSAWCGPGSVQNVQHLNQQPQTADESIRLHGQEASMNGQMDHPSAGNEAPASFGNVQLQQSMPRGSTHYFQ